MHKTNDFFAAGVIIGAISNIWINLFPFVYQFFGIKTRTPWGDMAALFFEAPEVYSFWAQLFGFFATFGVAITNGVLIGGLLRFTGRDFAYLKSVVVGIASVMFGFMVLYPSLGLTAGQHSILTNYLAVVNTTIFAIIAAYLFMRFTTVGQAVRSEQSLSRAKHHNKH